VVPRIEYGDLYKFIVSVGLGLVILAFVAPWFLLRESSDLLITVTTLNELTPTAQTAIAQRQDVILWYSRHAIWISFWMLLTGVVFTSWGLWNWWKKNQQFVDRQRAAESATIKAQARDIPELELERTAIEEVADDERSRNLDAAANVDQSDSGAVTIEQIERAEPTAQHRHAARNVRQIEQLVTSKLAQCLGDTHDILTDTELAGHRYDLVAIAGRNGYEDLLVEVKVLRQIAAGTTTTTIVQMLIKLQDYGAVYRRPVTGNVIFVVNSATNIGLVRANVNQILANIPNHDLLVRVDTLASWEAFDCAELKADMAHRQFARWAE